MSMMFGCSTTEEKKSRGKEIMYAMWEIGAFVIKFEILTRLILYARKFPRYVNFADFTVIYCYSKNLICENLLVCNN